MISIIIPTYTPGEYLYECLDSLLGQSSGTDLFEVILVLNGPREPYFSEIHTYLNKNKLKSTLLYDEQRGVSHARNTGLDTIKPIASSYIIFLDDDDKLSENFIEEMSKMACADKIVVSNSKDFYEDSRPADRKGYISQCYDNNLHSTYNVFKYRCFLSTIWGKLIPLNIIGDTRFDANFAIGEDALFAFSISNKIKEIVLTPENVYYLRRLRKGSASRSQRSKLNKLKNSYHLSLAYLKIYFRNPLSYNFPFFLSRIIAVLFQLIKRSRTL